VIRYVSEFEKRRGRLARGISAAQAFFCKALTICLARWPRKFALDGHAPSHQTLPLLGREDPRWKYVLVRKCRYLNNWIELPAFSCRQRTRTREFRIA